MRLRVELLPAATERVEINFPSPTLSTDIIHLIPAVCYEIRYDIYKIINRLYGNANSSLIIVVVLADD